MMAECKTGKQIRWFRVYLPQAGATKVKKIADTIGVDVSDLIERVSEDDKDSHFIY